MENDHSRPARILVLHHSRTGPARTMAELVAEGAGNVAATEVRLKSVAAQRRLSRVSGIKKDGDFSPAL